MYNRKKNTRLIDKHSQMVNLQLPVSFLHGQEIVSAFFYEQAKKGRMSFHKENHIAVLVADSTFKIHERVGQQVQQPTKR